MFSVWSQTIAKRRSHNAIVCDRYIFCVQLGFCDYKKIKVLSSAIVLNRIWHSRLYPCIQAWIKFSPLPSPGFYLLPSTVIVPLHENQNFIICDRNVSHNFLNSDSFFNAFYQRSANISFCNNCSFKQTDFKKKQWM